MVVLYLLFFYLFKTRVIFYLIVLFLNKIKGFLFLGIMSGLFILLVLIKWQRFFYYFFLHFLKSGLIFS